MQKALNEDDIALQEYVNPIMNYTTVKIEKEVFCDVFNIDKVNPNQKQRNLQEELQTEVELGQEEQREFQDHNSDASSSKTGDS